MSTTTATTTLTPAQQAEQKRQYLLLRNQFTSMLKLLQVYPKEYAAAYAAFVTDVRAQNPQLATLPDDKFVELAFQGFIGKIAQAWDTIPEKMHRWVAFVDSYSATQSHKPEDVRELQDIVERAEFWADEKVSQELRTATRALYDAVLPGVDARERVFRNVGWFASHFELQPVATTTELIQEKKQQ